MVLSTKIRIMIYKHTSSCFKKTVANHYRENISNKNIFQLPTQNVNNNINEESKVRSRLRVPRLLSLMVLPGRCFPPGMGFFTPWKIP